MRTVLQRAKNAQVEIDGKVNGKIDHGLVLLVGFEEGDGQEEIDYTVRKIVNCRIFSDENGKMNRGLDEVKGEQGQDEMDKSFDEILRIFNKDKF